LNPVLSGHHIRLGKPAYKDAVEKYELVVGKTRSVNEKYREVILPLQETVKPFRKVNLIVRAFNDGLAFRYQFPFNKIKNPGRLTPRGH
jgi:alpha-glucosidase